MIIGPQNSSYTPETHKRTTDLLDVLLAQSTRPRPVYGAADAIAGVAAPLVTAWQRRKADEKADTERAGARQRYGGLMEALLGQAPEPQAMGIPMPSGDFTDDYFKRLQRAESGGNDTARNPNSSATGRYQFIDSTWNGLMEKYPELGLTPDGRNDPAQQERAIRQFTQDNAAVLESAGVPVNDATLGMAHLFGAGGAKDWLTTSNQFPDISPIDFFSPQVVQANQSLFYNADGSEKTGGQFNHDIFSKYGSQQSVNVPTSPVDTLASIPSPGTAGVPPVAPSPATGGAPNGLSLALQAIQDPWADEGTRQLAMAMISRAMPQQQNLPADLQEYEYARNQGYQGSFFDYQQDLRRSGATTVNVGDMMNPAAMGDRKFYEAAGASQAEQWTGRQAQRDQAINRIADLNILERSIENAGTGAAAPLRTQLQGWAQSLGLEVGDMSRLADSQAIEAIAARIAPTLRQAGSGTMSDRDLTLFMQSLPNLATSPQGNRMIVGMLRKFAERQVEVGNIADMVITGQITREDGQRMLSELGDVISPEEAQQIRAMGAPETGGPPAGLSPEEWEFMTPEERRLFQ